jgi:hypothetical protein
MALLALARLTVADVGRQPAMWFATALALVALGLSYLFGQFNFEVQDRLRMLATAGVAVGVLNGLFLAVVGASLSVHDELASRTALTLFAKPVSRGAFLAGKALGIWLVAALATLVIALAHAGLLAWAGHTGFEEAGHRDMVAFDRLGVPWGAILTAHALGLGHSAVMACIASALALRLPLAANVLVSLAVFVAGHLLAGFGAMGGLAIPALALFNLDDSIQLPGHPVSLGYAGLTVLYSALYCAGCLFLGLALLKRQDIS